MKNFLNKNKYLILILLLLAPHLTSASKIYVDTNNKEFFVGDTIVLNIRIDSENKNINAIDGNILLQYIPKTVSISDISLSESVFPLWPRKPSLSVEDENISFAGGVPGGIKSQDAIIFKIILNLQEAEQVVLKPTNLSVYLNDGKGTRDTVDSNSLTINILPAKAGYKPVNEWSTYNSNDIIPPEKFDVYLGQEGSVFDGKKFLSFNATDKQSGIKYYEVKEGNLPSVRTNNTYVLQEQDKLNKVVITAYDNFGNARQIIYNPNNSQKLFYIVPFGIIILLILFFLYIFAKKIVQLHRNKNEFIDK